MGHGYSQVVNDSDQLQYEKIHRNDDQTMVVANVQPTGEWRVIATDFLAGGGRGASRTLGTYDTKRAARQRMTNWMSANPKGVQPDGGGGSGGVIGSMEEATNSIFRGGGLF